MGPARFGRVRNPARSRVFRLMPMRRGLVICGIALMLAPAAASAAPGDIDPTFSRDGYTRIGFGDADADATAIAMDEEGRIVIAGTTGALTNLPFGFQTVQDPLAIGIARLLPSGKLDRAFSGDGRMRLEVGDSPSVSDVVIDAEGRIVIGASAGGDLLAVRLRADGTPDPSFSDDGVATADAGAREAGGALLLGAGGTATVGGGSCTSGWCRFALARFGPAGAPDSSFDGDGVVVTAFPGDYAVANDLAAAPGGGLYAAGVNSRTNHDAAIARYTDSGALDPSYNGTGLAIVSQYTAGARRIFPDSTGGLVGVGDFGALYRLTPEANRDPSFATGTYLPRGTLGLDPGRYYLGAGSVGGCSRGCSPLDTSVARADISTGTVDRSFGGRYYQGLAVVDLDAKPDAALAVLADANHRPVTAGYSGHEMVVARLEVEDGPPDRDGDGVEDEADACEFRFSKREDGCPRSKRRITLHRRKREDLWVGRITSPEERCNFDQTVRVYRRQEGKDEVTAKVTSEGDGRWSADGNLRHGEYYARINGYFKQRYGTCTKARSHVVTIG